jgi:uncharacterized protein
MKDNFPSHIPVFPLSGVIYFPNTNLPLNIFEERYLNLVNDCMKTNKLMGMIQSQKNSKDVYKVGCLGKISDFKKNNDGRVIINLTGLTRFEVVKELKTETLYRKFEVKYEKFIKDISNKSTNLNDETTRKILLNKIKTFFSKRDLFLNWLELERLDVDQQVNTLSMIAPISNEEKQKLLETVGMAEKVQVFSDIIEFYLHDSNYDNITTQ